MKVQIVNKSFHKLPVYETEGSAGFDIKANIAEVYKIEPLQRMVIPTGLRMAIPQGYELQIRPRSGLALKNGLTVLNTPGTIDSDYRGEIKVILFNTDTNPFYVHPGDRIAQGVVCPITRVEWDEVRDLPLSERGDGGFGHTGI